MVKLLVASNNAKKLKELEKILADAGIAGIELLPLSAVETYPEPVEDCRTFADNALIKARAPGYSTPDWQRLRMIPASRWMNSTACRVCSPLGGRAATETMKRITSYYWDRCPMYPLNVARLPSCRSARW